MKILTLILLGLVFVQCSKSPSKKSKSITYIKKNPEYLKPEPFDMSSSPVLIKGARVMTATGLTFEKADLLMESGTIQKISADSITPTDSMEVIEGTGLTVTPGLIDVHSHMGVYPSPSVDAHEDGNEMVKPVTANVWAEHAFWPQDPDLWRAMAGGITTIQVLPGSGNLIGGRSFVTKLIPKLSAREMRFPGAKQGLKMACGENPKRVYKDKGVMTRMGNVAGYRKAYQEAIEYAREWSEYEKNGKKDGKVPKRNFDSETLLKVLSGDILVHFHCYRADDISAILDVAKEFGFKIRTIHHGLEAYKIAPRLAKENVATATWADWWGFKAEAYDGIPYNAALLEKAGAKAIIHSDSAIDVRFLNVEAAKALSSAKKLGLNFTEDQALAWITKNPAWALGLENKIGTLEPGKMGDVVIWDKHPFSVYAKAQFVFINGKKVFDREKKLRMRSDFEVGVHDMAFYDGRDFSENTKGQNIAWSEKTQEPYQLESQNFILQGATVFLNGKWKEKTTVVVKDGKIAEIDPPGDKPNLPIIMAEGQFLTPGLIEAESMLGLFDISLDSKAQDTSGDPKIPTPDYKAVDSLNTHNTRIPNKRQEGVLTSLSRIGGGVAASMGVAFDLVKDGLLIPQVALYGRIDKGWGKSKSRSAMWSEFRQFIDDSILYNKSPKDFKRDKTRQTPVSARHLKAMQPILQGKLPWVIHANRAEDIKNLTRLKETYKNINFVLSGAAEAWLVSDLLKKHNIPVMLSPSLQTPTNFDKLRARFDQAAFLHNKGIKIVITDGNDNGAGRTRQEAGLAVKYGLSQEAAMDAITKNPAEIFKLKRGEIESGATANLVLWNADPLEPTSWAQRIWVRGEEKSLFNRHRALADKYLKSNTQ